jgi:putative DNA primase/helicase
VEAWPVTTPLETALHFLALGFWPIPITAPDDRRVIAPGKQPIGKKWGQTRHTKESLERVYANHPGAGIGLKLGPEGGLVDFDVDEPEVGEGTLLRIFGGKIPETRGWNSTRGRHLIFLWDDRLAEYGKSLVTGHPAYPGLELRFGWSTESKQFQSVIPPSIGTDNQTRAWNGIEDIQPLPDCVFEDLDRHLKTPPKRKLTKRSTGGTDIEARAIRYLNACQAAVSGQRGHNQTFKVACKIGPGFDLPPETATRLIKEHFNPQCEPPWSDREIEHKIKDAYEREPNRGWLIGRTREGDAISVANGEAPGEADDDPHRLARVFLSRYSHSGFLTLRFWLEEWHRWDGSHYRIVSPSEIRAELNGCIKAEFDRIAHGGKDLAKKVTTGVINNTFAAVQNLALLSSEKFPAQPTWLGVEDEDLPEPTEVLPAQNGLIHLPALIEGRDAIIEPTPGFFSPNTLGYEFDPEPSRPREWLSFLADLWPEDQESIDTLQEWFGYLLTPDTSQQKILMIVGPKRSGKGTIARVFAALVGRLNVASPTLSGLATNFGLAPLIGKTVAIFADARLSGRADSQVIVERLLSISGEDSQTIDRKHLSSWTGNLMTRFVLISNELPRLGDSSGAMPSRMVILNLTRSFFGEEDTDLTRRLLLELPSILMWAIAGWARLRSRGRFLQPESSQGLLEDLENLSSPISSFVADRCELDPDFKVPIREFFEAWKEWCKEQGRDHPGDHAGLGRSLRAAFPSVKTVQERVGDSRERMFRGIRVLTKLF